MTINHQEFSKRAVALGLSASSTRALPEDCGGARGTHMGLSSKNGTSLSHGLGDHVEGVLITWSRRYDRHSGWVGAKVSHLAAVTHNRVTHNRVTHNKYRHENLFRREHSVR